MVIKYFSDEDFTQSESHSFMGDIDKIRSKISLYNSITNWTAYLKAVQVYKELVYMTEANWNINDPASFKLFKGRIPNLIDRRVKACCDLVWNYESDPISIDYLEYNRREKDPSLLDNQYEVDENLLTFYKIMTTRLNSYVKNQSQSFENALREAMRSWVEFGFTCFAIGINKNPDTNYKICVKTYDPQHVHHVFDSQLGLMEAITEDTNYIYDGIMGTYYVYYHNTKKAKIKNGTSSYEFEDATISQSWTITEVFVPQNCGYDRFSNLRWEYITPYSVKVIRTYNVDYTPIFISYKVEANGCHSPMAEGLMIIPHIAQIQEIQHKLDECVLVDLIPKLIKNTSHQLNSVKDEYGETGIDSTRMVSYEDTDMITGNGQPPLVQLSIQRVYQEAMYILNSRMETVEAIINPSFSLEQKGTARLNKAETYARMNTDENELDQSTSKFIHELLLPLIRNVFYCFYEDYKLTSEYKEISKEWKSKGINPLLIDITLNNRKKIMEMSQKVNIMAQNAQMWLSLAQVGGLGVKSLDYVNLAKNINLACGTKVINEKKAKDEVNAILGAVANQAEGQAGGDPNSQQPDPLGGNQYALANMNYLKSNGN